MTAEDQELFKKHFELYECYKKHSFIRNYSKTVYTELIHLYTTYISTKHTFSHWCSSCRAELVTAVYNWYTNEANTTWYKEEKVEDVTKLPFNTEERVLENKPIKRRRKPNK
jgi:hypothetical protein